MFFKNYGVIMPARYDSGPHGISALEGSPYESNNQINQKMWLQQVPQKRNKWF